MARKSQLRSKTPLKAKRGRKRKPRRDLLPTRKRLVNDIDALVSKIVRARDGRCVLCGATERLQCGHVFGRRSHGARFDVTEDGNCHTQCAGCNQRHNYDAWRFYNWFIKRFGQERFDALYRRWEAGRKYSRLELIALRAELLAKYTALNEANPLTQTD